jgi:1,4-dihydroxy-2-naphthoate octaprenyltransferase
VGSAVALGGGARSEGKVSALSAVLCLVVAVGFQVAANFANDYQDGLRGTDANRAGPVRLVASGTCTPGQVKRAALGSGLVACSAGLALAILVSPWLILVGVGCALAAWGYTGGSHPYGYLGLGEVGVLLCFGIAACGGTASVELGRACWLGVAAGVPVGLSACAVLEANNLRDIEGDALADKRTLAVRLGSSRASLCFIGIVWASVACAMALAVAKPLALLSIASVPIALVLTQKALAFKRAFEGGSSQETSSQEASDTPGAPVPSLQAPDIGTAAPLVGSLLGTSVRFVVVLSLLIGLGTLWR